MPEGLKHTIQCLCVLPQYRKRIDPPYHQFVVFSIIDDEGNVEEKHSECNNCGVIHKIIDICRSEIAIDRYELSILSKKDIKVMIPKQLTSILENYNCDLPTWEKALFLHSEEKIGEFIILSKTETDNGFDGKLLRFKKNNRYVIEPFIDRREI